MISLIVAVNNQNTIGLNGEMPWRNKEDLSHFRAYTMGKDLLMGRKTFEGLPSTLDGRNIHILTRNQSYPNAINDLDSFLEKYKNTENELVIAGGGEIYKLLMPHVDKIVLSVIHDNNIIGDTFFMDIDEEVFELVNKEIFDTYTLKTFHKRGE